MKYTWEVIANASPMTEARELSVVQRQSGKAKEAATALVVGSAGQYEEATTLLGKIKQVSSAVKAESEKVTKPLREALDAERARWKPLQLDCEEAERIVKGKMLAYVNEEQAKAQAAAAKLEAQVAAGKLTPEKALAKAEKIAEPERTSIGVGAVSQIRQVRKVYIVEPDKVPAKYRVIDEVAVRRDALAGVVIPGVEVRTENAIAGIVA